MKPYLLLLVWLAVVLASVFRLEQAVYSDPGWGMLAAEQHRIGKSPGIRTLMSRESVGLNADTAITVSWWAPAYQAVPYALREGFGLAWGQAVRATVLAAWVSALVGWALYFRWVLGAGAVWPWLLLCFAMCRYTNANFDIYDGGEYLLLGAFPWVLLLNLQALTSAGGPTVWLGLASGAAASAMFIVKYSSLPPALGMGAAWAWLWLRRRVSLPALAAYAAAGVGVQVALRAVGIPGGDTPGDAQLSGFVADRIPWAVSMLPLAATDLDSLIAFVFARPSRPPPPAWLSTAIGLGLLALLAPVAVSTAAREQWRAWRNDRRGEAAITVAVAMVVCVAFTLTALTVMGSSIDYQARHLRMAALTALPLLFGVLLAALRRGSTLPRLAACVAALLFFGLAPAYGAATLVDKAWRRASSNDTRVGASGLRLDAFGAGGDAVRFFRGLRSAQRDGSTLFYLPSPELALEVVDRPTVVRQADFTDSSQLARQRFRGCPKGGVLVTVPTRLEQESKLAIIQRSFADVTQWTHLDIEGAGALGVWRGECLRSNN